jgi:hypothetical protein
VSLATLPDSHKDLVKALLVIANATNATAAIQPAAPADNTHDLVKAL